MFTPALPPAASGRARGAAVLAAMGGVLGLVVSASSGCPNDPPATTGDTASGGPEDGGPGHDGGAPERVLQGVRRGDRPWNDVLEGWWGI
jgi:hypothetical protein